MRHTSLGGRLGKRLPGTVRTRIASMEQLEDRTLLSVGVTLRVSRGIATLTVADNGANCVEVAKNPNGTVGFQADAGHYSTAPWQTVNSVVVSTYGGNDRITVFAGMTIPVTVKAGAGNDVIEGLGASRLTAYGSTGDDRICQTGPGVLVAYGDGGDDLLVGGPGNDLLCGGNGNDVLYGWAGNDKLYGQSGMDTIYAGAGFDYVNGGCYGVDIYYVTPGQDKWVLDNQPRIHDIVHRYDPTDIQPPWTHANGVLTVDWSRETVGADIRATGPSSVLVRWCGTEWTVTGVNRFVFFGSAYDDHVDMTLFAGETELHGAAGNDVLKGGLAADRIFGDAGNDWLYGNAGCDEIVGGDGLDEVFGGSDADWVNLQDGFVGDRFRDFNPGEGDSFLGDGSSLTTADEQFGTDAWLLRATSVTIASAAYVDPLGRIPATVTLAGVDAGLHLFASNLRVEVPQLSAFVIDTSVRNSLLSAGFTIDVVVVSGGGLDPLQC